MLCHGMCMLGACEVVITLWLTFLRGRRTGLRKQTTFRKLLEHDCNHGPTDRGSLLQDAILGKLPPRNACWREMAVLPGRCCSVSLAHLVLEAQRQNPDSPVKLWQAVEDKRQRERRTQRDRKRGREKEQETGQTAREWRETRLKMW